MKASIAILMCVLAGVAGLAGGYAIRVSTHSAESSADASARVAAGMPGAKAVPRGPQRGTSHAEQVESKARRSEGAHHWLQWMSGVESASLSDLVGLARMARDNPGALHLIAYRWIELDPEHLLETIKRESRILDSRGEGSGFPVMHMLRALFDEWPRNDPDAAIAALNAEEPLLGRSGLRHGVLNTIFEEDPARGLKLMNEWSIYHFGPNTGGVEKWARADPVAAAQAVLDNPAGYGAQHSMEAIAKIWAKSDPGAAMDFAVQASGRQSGTLRDKVLSEWAARDRAAAADWLAGQDDERLRAELSPLIVEAWAKEDPNAALSWCEDNLDGHRLVTAVSKLAQGAAAADPQAATALLAGIEDARARTQAAIAIGKTWFPQRYPSDQGVKPEAVEWIRNLEDPVLQAEVLEKIAWGWSTQDREGLMEVLAGPVGERASLPVFTTVIQSLAREDPVRALEWAQGLPENRVEPASTRAYSIWTQHRPAEALDWLVALPGDDTRRPGMLKNLVMNLSFQPDTALAVERLGKLPATDHEVARAQIAKAGIPEEKKQRLLGALKN